MSNEAPLPPNQHEKGIPDESAMIEKVEEAKTRFRMKLEEMLQLKDSLPQDLIQEDLAAIRIYIERVRNLSVGALLTPVSEAYADLTRILGNLDNISTKWASHANSLNSRES